MDDKDIKIVISSDKLYSFLAEGIIFYDIISWVLSKYKHSLRYANNFGTDALPEILCHFLYACH